MVDGSRLALSLAGTTAFMKFL